MALVNINGVGVISGTIMCPLQGVWSADLVIDQPDGEGFAAGTKVTIEANGLEWKGIVAPDRSGDFLDAVHVRVLGGAGGMAKNAKRRSFVAPGALARDVASRLAEDAGESLSSTTSTAFQNTNLNAWAVTVMPVSQALLILIAVVLPGAGWRILPDGKLWIGVETWPTSDAEFELLEETPADGSVMLGVDAPAILPGTTLDGVGKVNRVEHQILRRKIRSRIWTEQSEDDRGLAPAVQALARQELAKIDYFALYNYKVKSQSADLTTVDVEPVAPNDARLPGLSKVPVREGSAVKVQFATDAKVLVGWDAGDPSRPYCALGLSSDSVQRIQLGGNTDAARKGDGCDAGTLLFVSGSGGASLTYFGPGVPPTGPGTSIALSAEINEGSTKVGLG